MWHGPPADGSFTASIAYTGGDACYNVQPAATYTFELRFKCDQSVQGAVLANVVPGTTACDYLGTIYTALACPGPSPTPPTPTQPQSPTPPPTPLSHCTSPNGFDFSSLALVRPATDYTFATPDKHSTWYLNVCADTIGPCLGDSKSSPGVWNYNYQQPCASRRSISMPCFACYPIECVRCVF